MTPAIDVRRLAHIPDATRIARYQRSPELGPQLLFFSKLLVQEIPPALNVAHFLVNILASTNHFGVEHIRLSQLEFARHSIFEPDN